jgi:hypothetical protein
MPRIEKKGVMVGTFAIRSRVVSQKMLYDDQRKVKPSEGTLQKLEVACKIGMGSIKEKFQN